MPRIGHVLSWAIGTAFVACLVLLFLARARAGAQPNERDVTYGEADGQKLLLDVYLPEKPGAAAVNSAPRPAVLFVHGGGWRGGNKRDFGALAAGVAKQGYVCFSVDYRLVASNRNLWPAAWDDVQRAVRWVRANAARYHVDPQRIAAVGASAGGHLVALLGTTDTRDNSDPRLASYSSRVDCVVDMFGPVDFTAAMKPKAPGIDVPALVSQLMGKSLQEAPQLYREASPLFHVDRKSAPFLILHGTADPWVPVEQSERFDAALRSAGIESTLIKFEGEGHGFKNRENVEKFVLAMRDFLKRHLQPR
jgi:acetyl esterase/lipase